MFYKYYIKQFLTLVRVAEVVQISKLFQGESSSVGLARNNSDCLATFDNPKVVPLQPMGKTEELSHLSIPKVCLLAL